MSAENAKRGFNEQDEFLLSRLLDEDLPADQAQALRERMAREPALAEAFAGLRKVHELLGQRRSDQPGVDYDSFRAELMSVVRGGAIRSRPTGGRALRFPIWLRIGVPVALAATIALVIWVQPGLVSKLPAGPSGPAAQMAKNAPAVPGQPSAGDNAAVADARRRGEAPGAGEDRSARPGLALASAGAIVRFNRPEVSGPAPSSALRVSYARSDQLDQSIRQQDQAGRERPSRYLLLTGSSTRRSSASQELAELPLL